MNMIGKDAIDNRRAIASLPPLSSRLYAPWRDDRRRAVVDRQFGTTDVFVVMPVERIDTRYIDYFSPASRSRDCSGVSAGGPISGF